MTNWTISTPPRISCASSRSSSIPRVVHVNRLHILQRFHDYLTEETNLDTLPDDLLRDRYKALISQAYADFVKSDAIAEKVFKVHKEQADRHNASFVSLESLTLSGVR